VKVRREAYRVEIKDYMIRGKGKKGVKGRVCIPAVTMDTLSMNSAFYHIAEKNSIHPNPICK
jgi:hypothetical protein